MKCPFCMEEIDDNVKFCARCGKSLDVANEMHQLPIGSLIGNRYYVGAVIRQGGFGITYVGCDTRLNKKIAIKEYFPSGLVSRSSDYSQDISITAGDRTPVYEKEKQRFLSEANILAKFSGEKYIVNVTDVFSEHNTIYMIMEYVEGLDLDAYLRTVQRMDFTSAFNMLKPIMDTLARVHEKGLIHRDISPSNIKVLPDRTPVLLDFGAAREFDVEEEKSYSIILKPGYAPAEQYQSRGVQGPWTDVYAICATLYKMITGITPANAVDRMVSDTLKKPSEVGAKISPKDEMVLMKGMEIVQNKRTASMRELCLGFMNDDPEKALAEDTSGYEKTQLLQDETKIAVTQTKNEDTGSSKKGKTGIIIAMIAILAAVLVVAGLFVIPKITQKSGDDVEMAEDSDQDEDEEDPDEEEKVTSKSKKKNKETTAEDQDEATDEKEDLAGLDNEKFDNSKDKEQEKEIDEDTFLSDDIELLSSTDVLLVGDSIQLLVKSGSAYINTSSIDSLEWTSKNENVAKVENGVVTGLSAGSTTISVKHKDISADYDITVTTVDNGQGAKISADYRNVSINQNAGATVTLSFTGNMPSDFGALCYVSEEIGTLSYYWGKVEGNKLELTINPNALSGYEEGNVRILIYPQDDPYHIIASETIHVRVS